MIDRPASQIDRDAGVELSDAARTVWGKSQTDDETHLDLVGWLPLHQHLEDTARIAELLWDGWVAERLRQTISIPFGDDQALARRLFVWLAGTHDLGKVSPAFAVQVPALAYEMQLAGFAFDPSLANSPERRAGRHERIGHLAVTERLVREHGFDRRRAIQYASIISAHHGLPPDDAQLQAARDPRLMGTGLWESVRTQLLEQAERRYLEDGDLEAWRATPLTEQAEVLLSGLVIVADWIASSDHLPLARPGTQPEEATGVRVARAWGELDLPRPWHPPVPDATTSELFATRFELPTGARPRPVQEALAEIARTLEEPALVILEAEMGVGKTEAALAAAEILAARFRLGGVFVALPTQATSDGMFARVLRWADRLGLPTPGNVFLAHGKSGMNTDYSELTRDAWFRAIGEEPWPRVGERDRSESVIAHHWYSDPKRGPLANFVVGSIDQALFGALRSRHLALRHLALAGKVVIVDEAHAYSAFMNVFTDRLLHWLGAYGVPVVMLSATLPADRRRRLVAAYDSGRAVLAGAAPTLPRRERVSHAARHEMLDGDIGYPLITVSGGAHPPRVVRPDPAGEERIVQLERMDDSSESLVALLDDALRDGGCVAVIRNTVGRAQETARVLRERFGARVVTVAHARFLALDRAENDRELLHRFGPPGPAVARPVTAIVVATQVIEQSLDLDFDLMVTDLAPVDLLLQRTGRLHRHPRGSAEVERPEPLRTPRLVVTGVDWATSPPGLTPPLPRIYHPNIRYRTLAVLDGVRELHLPSDIPRLVQAVYGSQPVGPQTWRGVLDTTAVTLEREIVDKESRASDFRLGRVITDEPSLIGLVHGRAADPTTPSNAALGRAAVRDSGETLEVLLLQRTADGTIRTPAWLAELGGEALPLDAPPGRRLARAILGCSIRLPEAVCRGRIDELIVELERANGAYDELKTWFGSRELRGELALVIDEDGNADIDDGRVRLQYSRMDGMEIHRND